MASKYKAYIFSLNFSLKTWMKYCTHICSDNPLSSSIFRDRELLSQLKSSFKIKKIFLLLNPVFSNLMPTNFMGSNCHPPKTHMAILVGDKGNQTLTHLETFCWERHTNFPLFPPGLSISPPHPLSIKAQKNMAVLKYLFSSLDGISHNY